MAKSKIPEHIEIPILNTEYMVYVYFGESKLLLPLLRELGYPRDKNTTATDHWNDNRGICFRLSGCAPVIALPGLPTAPLEIGTLAHEATHAIEHVFDAVGQPLGGEIFAHSIAAVVRGTLAYVEEKTKRRK